MSSLLLRKRVMSKITHANVYFHLLTALIQMPPSLSIKNRHGILINAKRFIRNTINMNNKMNIICDREKNNTATIPILPIYYLFKKHTIYLRNKNTRRRDKSRQIAVSRIIYTKDLFY